MLDMGPRADIGFLWIKKHIVEGFCSSPRLKPLKARLCTNKETCLYLSFALFGIQKEVTSKYVYMDCV